MELQSFVERYPKLYHMAERDTWESICKLGLLSTAAILDLLKIEGINRKRLEAQHRPEKVAVSGEIVLRDQKPMPPERLSKALIGGVTAAEWYAHLNGKVFLWAEESRLIRLLGARAYRNLEHDVLTICTKSLVDVHEKNMWVCHMNSGNTFPMPHKRGRDLFQRIKDYPVNAKGKPIKEVVEVVVDHVIGDVAKHVVAVRRMKGSAVIGAIK